MHITNMTGLPQPIVSAIENDDYDAGPAHISVTQLIDSPLIRRLRKDHEDELAEDASDHIWSLFGKAMHEILRRADVSAITERRLYMHIVPNSRIAKPTDSNVIRISGQFDRLCLLDGVLQDYKVMSKWEHIFGLKANREAQLNVYRCLLGSNNVSCHKLEVISFYRDWSIGEYERALAKVGGDDTRCQYPPAQVHVHDVPIWEPEVVARYILVRLERHFPAFDIDPIDACNDEEMWLEPGKVAIMRKDRKKAIRVFDTEDACYEYMNDAELDVATHYLEQRPPKYQRCRQRINGRAYCPVASRCPKWAAIREKHNLDWHGGTLD